MELCKPGELIRDTAGMVARAGRFALKQVQGGAWGEFGERYGEAVGGYKPHPASITFYTTGEQLQLDIPENIQLGAE